MTLETGAQLAAAVGTIVAAAGTVVAAWFARAAAQQSRAAVAEMVLERQFASRLTRTEQLQRAHDLLALAVTEQGSPQAQGALVGLRAALVMTGRSLPAVETAITRGFAEGRADAAFKEIEAAILDEQRS